MSGDANDVMPVHLRCGQNCVWQEVSSCRPVDLQYSCSLTIGPVVHPPDLPLRICTADSIQMTLPGWSRMIASARHVDLTVEPAVPFDWVQRFLTGPGWAALCLLRGVLPVHASAVARNGRAIVVAGGSGSGKTNVVLGLRSRGWELLTDDVSGCDLTDGRVVVEAVGDRVDVWPDTAARWGLQCARSVSAKSPWFGGDRSVLGRLTVSGVVTLGRSNSHATAERLTGAEAFRAVLTNVHLASALGATVPGLRAFMVAAAVASLPVSHVRHSRRDLTALVDMVEQLALGLA